VEIPGGWLMERKEKKNSIGLCGMNYEANALGTGRYGEN
jgi:hypothetical protein